MQVDKKHELKIVRILVRSRGVGETARRSCRRRVSEVLFFNFFFSSRRRHTRCLSDWSSDVCSSDLYRMHSGPPMPSWFRFHMVLGIGGPLCILYHCNFSTGATNSNVALFSMLTVAGSGIIGRYIYAHIHNGLYGRKLEFGELRAGAYSLRSLSGRISFV